MRIRPIIFRDKNLTEFHKIILKAYKEALRTGKIPAKEIAGYNKAVRCGRVKRDKKNRPIFVWRILRRRTARLYARTNKMGFELTLDWEEIYKWVLDNIVPILKMLLMVVPLLI